MGLFINSKLWKQLRKILQSQDSHFLDFFILNNFKCTEALWRRQGVPFTLLRLVLVSYVTRVHSSKLRNQRWCNAVNVTTDLSGFLQGFYRCPLSVPGANPGSHEALSPQGFLASCYLWHFLSLSLTPLLFTLLKRNDQSCCRMTLSLRFSDVFSLLGWSYGFGGQTP